MSGGESRSKELSEFVKPIIQAGVVSASIATTRSLKVLILRISNQDVFSTGALPIMNSENLEIMSRLLRRPVPSAAVIGSMKRDL